MKSRRNIGFTLIEFLIATSIMGLIGLAILTAFGTGFSVYERIQAFGGAQADALLALEEFEKDARNIFAHSALPVVGEPDRVAFPAVVETLDDDGETPLSSLGKIVYFLDSGGPDGKALKKAVLPYSEAVSGEAPDAATAETLVGVNDLGLRYFSYNPEDETYSWEGSWRAEDGGILKGIEITLTYQDQDRAVELARNVFIPVDGLAKKQEVEEEDEVDVGAEDEAEGGGDAEIGGAGAGEGG